MKCDSSHFRIGALLLSALLLGLPSAHAFSDAKAAIGALIKAGKIDEARTRVRDYLAQDPNDVDAIMMKGNVILNEYFDSQPSIAMSANDNESIYDSSIGSISEPVRVLPPKLAKRVTALWNRCLAIDPSREDIYKGVAYVEAMALEKKALIAHLARMKKALPNAKHLYYNMGDYARMFDERGHFDDAMEVYGAILTLYPQVAGLYSDVAGMYARHGDLDKVHHYLQIAMTKPDPDAMVYANAVILLTVTGDYDGALGAMRSRSALRQDSEWLVYRALLRRSRGANTWRADLERYLKQAKVKAAGRPLAQYLLGPDNKGDLSSYRRANDLADNFTAYQILLNRGAMRSFPDRYQPLYDYADTMTWYKNYRVAIPIWKHVLSLERDLSAKRKQAAQVRYAWALWANGQRSAAQPIWERLLGSDQFYVHSAAAYFLGKYALDHHDRKTALHYFDMVDKQANKSKYATMAWNQANALRARH